MSAIQAIADILPCRPTHLPVRPLPCIAVPQSHTSTVNSNEPNSHKVKARAQVEQLPITPGASPENNRKNKPRNNTKKRPRRERLDFFWKFNARSVRPSVARYPPRVVCSLSGCCVGCRGQYQQTGFGQATHGVKGAVSSYPRKVRASC